jgi:hypothetical protein
VITMRAQMTVTYTKILGAPAVHRWPGTPGLVATCLPWTGGLPHDLGHWFMEAQVDLRWGFWSLAGQQAPFSSLTLVQGRWPKGRQEWFDRVRRRHGLSMLHAEAHGGPWLADPDLDVRRDWSEIRRSLARMYAFTESPLARLGPHDVEALRPFAQRAAATWDALAPGGSVEVRWPGANDLVVVPTEARGSLSLDGPGASHLTYDTTHRGPGGRLERVTVVVDTGRRLRSNRARRRTRV